IKALVECGIGDDVVTVVVDGIVRMRDRMIPGVDLAALRRQAQESGETVWRRVQEWDPLGRTAEEMSPWSFPIKNEDGQGVWPGDCSTPPQRQGRPRAWK